MPLAIVHNPVYVADLPEGHRFPMDKYSALARLIEAEGLASERGFHVPGPAPASWLKAAHAITYVDQALSLSLPPAIIREIGLPLSESVVRRARTATAGTLMTARLALDEGLAANTAGGSHHARHDHGAGFCVFNDVAVAASILLADGAVRRIMIVDCDVHQGDGTAAIFAGNAAVFTLSLHAAHNYPVRKVPSSLDVALKDGTGDAAYLTALRQALDSAFQAFTPDLAFYNGGVDVHAEDRLGRLALTDAGIAARDRMVIEAFASRAIPIAGVIGGGYGKDAGAIARRHLSLFTTMRAFA